MKQDRPRLVKFKVKGIMCKQCKYALPVDAKHNKYYCVKPEERYWIYYGEHVCGKGEQKG